MDGGVTDNLFTDSIAVADDYGALSLDIEQRLFPFMSAYYSGSLKGYAETSGLGTSYNNGGLNLSTSRGRVESLWLTTGALNLSYNDLYSIYDRQRMFVALGGLYRTSSTLRLRTILNLNNTVYPSYNDSIGVNYSEFNGAVGSNISLQLPLAVDIETGYQLRNYKQFENPTKTSYTYLRLRLSRPLDSRTGIHALMLYRNQMSTNTDDLYALYSSGIDPGDLLWDGLRLKTGINRYFNHWKTSLSLGYRNANFAETSVITGRSQRQDQRLNLSVSARRALVMNQLPFQIWMTFNYMYEDNRSSDSFYTYTANIFRAGISFETY